MQLQKNIHLPMVRSNLEADLAGFLSKEIGEAGWGKSGFLSSARTSDVDVGVDGVVTAAISLLGTSRQTRPACFIAPR